MIALAMFNDPSKMDILLKLNEISDPFSIRSGDLLIIPDEAKASAFYINPPREPIRKNSSYLDDTKKSKKDINRLKALSKISSSTKNGSSVNLKTNELKPGESNIRIDISTNTMNV